MIRIDAARGARVVAGGRSLVSFGGCDLLGLARHPRVVRAAAAALRRYGASASASRTTTGTLAVHVALEEALARLFGTADCVVLPSGWMAPAALVAALAATDVATPGASCVGPGGSGTDRDVIADERLHPAGAAAAAGAAAVRTYRHFDAADAARLCAGASRPILVTDGADPAAGRLAPLAELASVARAADGLLVIDDAHGAGLLGRRGRGSAEAAGARGRHVHSCGSLSKAFGAGGGFVPCSARMAAAIRALPVYAGATPVAPAVAAAATEAARMIAEGGARRRLAERIEAMRALAPPSMRPLPEPGLPWFGIRHESARVLARWSRTLADRGFLAPHVRYFGGPAEGMLKVAVSAAHSERDLERLARAVATL